MPYNGSIKPIIFIDSHSFFLFYLDKWSQRCYSVSTSELISGDLFFTDKPTKIMIEITTSLLMIASAFSPMTFNMIGNTKDATVTDPQASTNVVSLPADHPLTTVSIEAYVRDYFKDIPLLAEISKCESTFRQFGSNGKVIRGMVNSDDIGLMQINKYYHEEDAVKLGFDIYTIDGNLQYAKWLYGKYGSDPWVHSSKCWNKYVKIAMN